MKAYVGPMLCHFGFLLGPCWVIWGKLGLTLGHAGPILFCFGKDGFKNGT